jgi:hypothetical protein
MSWRWAWGSSSVQSAQSVGMFGSCACGWTLLACRNKDADQCQINRCDWQIHSIQTEPVALVKDVSGSSAQCQP